MKEYQTITKSKGKREKELNCLYGISKLIYQKDSLEALFQGSADFIPPSWQYPEITCAQIKVFGQSFRTENFKKTKWKQSREIIVTGERIGAVEVYYLEEKPEIDEGPFLLEERELIDEIAFTLSKTIEHKQAKEKIKQYQKKLKTLASKLTLVEEKERRVIASELHDHIGQSLAFSHIMVAKAKKYAPEGKLANILDEISQSLFDTILATKELVFDLSTPILDEIGLAEAISNWLEEKVRKKHGFRIEFIDDNIKIPLSNDLESILFRNVRELLTNVIKHSQATRVIVKIERQEIKLKITIQDNGIGFEYDSKDTIMNDAGHFGLFNIHERMTDYDGTLEIITKPGNGCRAILSVPLWN
jgi:signal transduction histidine kinase